MDTKHLLAVGMAVVGSAAMPSHAIQAPLKGTFALPGETENVVGEMMVRETGPLTRELLIAFTDKATGQPITRFDEELTQELHVLGTDSEFSNFIHEHAKKAEPDGRFRVAMQFPAPGTYHVYADAVPTGFKQQVVRFEVPVGAPAQPVAPRQVDVGMTEAADGPYAVRLDPDALRAGTENMALTVLKDGKPATDLGLFLGVPAHAVFIGTDDLAYVHAHAMTADAAMDGHSAHGKPADAMARIPADMMLHVKPPHAGRYALWIQFKAGDAVRTVPFVVKVPASS